jgi:tetratricopeptide (TPR) repeat protein
LKNQNQPQTTALILSFSVLQSMTCLVPVSAVPVRDIASAQAAYQKNTNDRKSAEDLAKAYLAADKPAEASRILEAASEAAPSDANLHYLLGESLFRSNKFAEGAFELKRASNLDATKGIYAVRAGEALLAAKRYDELTEWCNQSLSRVTDDKSKLALQWLTMSAASERNKTSTPPQRTIRANTEEAGGGR